MEWRAVYLFSVDEKPYFLVSVPEKEAEEILAKLKEGVGQMPVSDKNHMEAGKMASGALEGAEKEPEQLCYAWKTSTDIRAMEPMHQAFAAITAVQLWRPGAFKPGMYAGQQRARQSFNSGENITPGS